MPDIDLVAIDSAAEHRAEAARHEKAAVDSLSAATPTVLSQWGHGVEAERHRLAADIADHGGTAVFPALFDLDGNLVAAKEIETRFGWAWGLLADDDPHAEITGWFSPSRARDDDRYTAANARKGYYIGAVRAPAKAGYCKAACITNVRAIPIRIDGGFTRDVEIVDNGH